MKLKSVTLLFFAFLPLFSFGQVSCLTIFSEDGDKFILFLNGQQQNMQGQTNLRLDGLTQPYYKARIVFEDKAKGQIDKSIPVRDPATDQAADVVYRIKNKDGDMKLRYYSAQPIQPNYVAPPDVYVVHYGVPDQGTTVTQTTTTTTNNSNVNGNVSIGFNAGGGNGGVNMNVNVNDPNAYGGGTQTTTTTTSYSTTTTNSGYDNTNYNNQPPPCQSHMAWNNFKSAKTTVENASFEATKLSTAKSILASNCFNTDQVIEICKLFGFEASKLEFAKFAYGKTTDPGNYFKVGNILTYDASKQDLNNYISGGR